MARVAFISLYDRNAYGLRVMSANLRRHGHECHIIFLKRYDTNPTYRLDLEVGEYPWMGVAKSGRIFKYASNSQINNDELQLLARTLEAIDPQIIGMTVNTPLRVQAVKVTTFLKQRAKVPIVWGGYDPTTNPEDCLRLCDYACIGEGDQAMLEIAARIDAGQSFDDVGNLAFFKRGFPVRNPKYPAEQNLDSYPWRDDDPEFKYFIEDNAVVERYDRVNDRPRGVYQAMSARGCPYKCSYCCEATFKELYDGQKFLRRRSPEDIVAELATAKERFGLTKIQFEDEIFAMNLKWLEVFAPLYKRDVGLPFSAYIYPTRNIENILRVLKDAGLNYCCLALESGSERVNKRVFDRVYDRELFLHTARVCKSLGLPFYTDVITYNPYEDEEDLRKTLDVLVDIGGGFDMCINKLFVLPGTKLAQQMKVDGIAVGDSSRDRMFNYYCRLFWISSMTSRPAALIRLIDRVGVFRQRPGLLNPLVIEAGLHPLRWAASSIARRLPRPVADRLRDWRERRATQASPEVAASTVVCR